MVPRVWRMPTPRAAAIPLSTHVQASALTATELTNSPNHVFGVWGKWEEWGEMGGGMRGNGGELGGNGGEWGLMNKSKVENVGTTSRLGEKWGEIGGKREKVGGIEEKMGRNTRFSQSHFPHFSGGRTPSPQFPL